MAPVKGFKDTIEWYDKNASAYAGSTKSHPRNARVFTSLLHGKKILDAGCGPGHDTNMFTQMGFEAIGVDVSVGLLTQAKQTYPNCTFVEGNFLSLSFEDETFDGVWSQASLLHFETGKEVRQALKEFYRVLKAKGVIYVAVKKQQGNTKTAVVTDSLSHADRFFQYFTEDELRNLLLETGFSVIKTELQEDSHGRNEVQWIIILGRKN